MKCLLFLALFIFASNAQVCFECTTLLSAVESWVENNQTVTEIIQQLDQYCNLNSQFELECDVLVAYGVPALVAYLQNNGDPQKLCAALGLCSTPPVIKAGPYCGYCQTVVASVESYLEQNATVEEIEQNIDQLCQLLPAGFNIYCESFVIPQIPTIIQYLEQKYTPQQVCGQIGLCAARNQKLFKGQKNMIKL